MKIIKPTDEALWSGVFGSMFEVNDWWIDVTYLMGDWDVPGKVRLVISNPDDENGTIIGTLEMDNIRRAFDSLVRQGVINVDCIYSEDDVDLDSIYGDAVVQQALLGDIIYG